MGKIIKVLEELILKLMNNERFILILLFLIPFFCFSQTLRIDTARYNDGSWGVGYVDTSLIALSRQYTENLNPKVGLWKYYYPNNQEKKTMFYWIDSASISIVYSGVLNSSMLKKFFKLDYTQYEYYLSYENIADFETSYSDSTTDFIIIGRIENLLSEYYENGNKKIVADFQDNRHSVVVKQYYENGKLDSVFHYKDKKLDGECIYYSLHEQGYWHVFFNSGKRENEYFEASELK